MELTLFCFFIMRYSVFSCSDCNFDEIHYYTHLVTQSFLNKYERYQHKNVLFSKFC